MKETVKRDQLMAFGRAWMTGRQQNGEAFATPPGQVSQDVGVKEERGGTRWSGCHTLQSLHGKGHSAAQACRLQPTPHLGALSQTGPLENRLTLTYRPRVRSDGRYFFLDLNQTRSRIMVQTTLLVPLPKSFRKNSSNTPASIGKALSLGHSAASKFATINPESDVSKSRIAFLFFIPWLREDLLNLN